MKLNPFWLKAQRKVSEWAQRIALWAFIFRPSPQRTSWVKKLTWKDDFHSCLWFKSNFTTISPRRNKDRRYLGAGPRWPQAFPGEQCLARVSAPKKRSPMLKIYGKTNQTHPGRRKSSPFFAKNMWSYYSILIKKCDNWPIKFLFTGRNHTNLQTDVSVPSTNLWPLWTCGYFLLQKSESSQQVHRRHNFAKCPQENCVIHVNPSEQWIFSK